MQGLCDHTLVSEFSGTAFLRTRNMCRVSINLGCGCRDDPHSPHPQPCRGFSVHLQEIMQELKAWTWLSLEDFVLTEISQTQRDRPCMIPLISSTRSGQIHAEKVEGWLPGAGAKSRAHTSKTEIFNLALTQKIQDCVTALTISQSWDCVY